MKLKLKYNTLPPPHLLHGLYTLNAVLDTCLNITITESTHALWTSTNLRGFLGNVSILRNSLVLVRLLYTWTLMGNNDLAASNWICRWTAFLMVWTELFLSAIIPVTSTQNIKCLRCFTNSFRARSASVETNAGRLDRPKILKFYVVDLCYTLSIYWLREFTKKCNTQETVHRMRFKFTFKHTQNIHTKLARNAKFIWFQYSFTPAQKLLNKYC